MQRRRSLAPVLATALLAGASACTSGGSATDVRGATRAADALAAGLAAGRVAVPVQGAAAAARRQLAALTGGMAPASARVRVAKVSVDGGRADVRLRWAWSLPGAGRTWSYDAPATFTQAGGRWRVRWAAALVQPSLRRGETLQATLSQPARGDITGAGGVRLVTDRPVYRFGIDKTQVATARQAASARSLAGLLGIDAAGYVQRVRAAGPQAFVEAIVLRRADAGPGLRARVAKVKGAVALPDQVPLAPTKEFARAILGTVGPVTAEMVNARDSPYAAGDQAGLSGLEARYDAQLRGSAGAVVRAVGHGGKQQKVLFRVGSHPGTDLRTTLDPALQRHAEAALAGVGPASALVAIRPSDGAILAAASGPGSNGYNTATFGQYAPGSTFKMVSGLALLRSGLTMNTTVPCTTRLVVDGKLFTNYSEYPPGELGRIPLRTAFANSCNTAFISQNRKVSDATLQGAAAALGLGVDHDLGFPAYFGSVPNSGSPTEHAAAMIGQGKVLASPMAMATVAASVARGATVVPRLLPDQKPVHPTPAAPLTPGEVRQLRAMMRLTVTSGTATVLAGLPGPPVLAKTGTAEFGTATPPQTHAWMVADQGDLAVAAFVDVG
ncbi:MAG: penicillin-binding transpeptidase domain-containing protein, partial [Nocardioidaceae bacterium]